MRAQRPSEGPIVISSPEADRSAASPRWNGKRVDCPPPSLREKTRAAPSLRPTFAAKWSGSERTALRAGSRKEST